MCDVRRGSARVLVAAAVAAAFGACTHSSETSPSVALNVAALDFDTVAVRWTALGGVDSYELEGRLGDRPWETIAVGIPADVDGVDLSLERETPELLVLGFRLRCVRGATPSPWVEQTFQRGVRAPVIAAVVSTSGKSTPGTGPIVVSWQSPSRVATAIELERSVGSAAASLPASLASGAYADDDLADGTVYTYRARVGTGGTWSAWSGAATAGPIALLPPSHLAVVRQPGGTVRVSWSPRSTRSNAQHLNRWTAWPELADVLPSLSPTASEFVDALGSIWPVLSYQVVTVTDGFREAVWGDVATVEPFTIAGPLTLRASAVSQRSGESFARDGLGQVHVASQGSGGDGDAYVSRATGAGLAVHSLPGFVPNMGPLRLGVDGRDRVHVVYPRAGPADGTPPIVTHAWWDGAAWRSEDPPIALAAGTTAAMFWAGVAGSGAVHVLAADANGAWTHTALEDGAWATTTLDAGSFTIPFGVQFAVARDGTAYHLSVGATPTDDECHLRVRPPGGTWGAPEVVPGCRSAAWLVPADAGQLGIVYTDNGPDFFSTDVFFTRRLGEATYSSAELVINRPPNGYTFGLWAASAPDASRAVIAIDVADGYASPTLTRLCVRDASGRWTTMAPGPGTARGWLLGFDATGKVWAVGSFGWSDPDPVRYALLEEQ